MTILKDMSSFYDFVPYKFGPFSFTLYRDIERLRINKIVVNDNKTVVLSQIGRRHVEAESDSFSSLQKTAVLDLFSMVKEWDTNYLIKHVYRTYPWYTVKSENVSMKSASRTNADHRIASFTR